jgi:hypothetical protein
MDKQEFAQRIFIELVTRIGVDRESPSDLAIRAIHFAEDFQSEWDRHGRGAEPAEARDRRV